MTDIDAATSVEADGGTATGGYTEGETRFAIEVETKFEIEASAVEGIISVVFSKYKNIKIVLDGYCSSPLIYLAEAKSVWYTQH